MIRAVLSLNTILKDLFHVLGSHKHVLIANTRYGSRTSSGPPLKVDSSDAMPSESMFVFFPTEVSRFRPDKWDHVTVLKKVACFLLNEGV